MAFQQKSSMASSTKRSSLKNNRAAPPRQCAGPPAGKPRPGNLLAKPRLSFASQDSGLDSGGSGNGGHGRSSTAGSSWSTQSTGNAGVASGRSKAFCSSSTSSSLASGGSGGQPFNSASQFLPRSKSSYSFASTVSLPSWDWHTNKLLNLKALLRPVDPPALPTDEDHHVCQGLASEDDVDFHMESIKFGLLLQSSMPDIPRGVMATNGPFRKFDPAAKEATLTTTTTQRLSVPQMHLNKTVVVSDADSNEFDDSSQDHHEELGSQGGTDLPQDCLQAIEVLESVITGAGDELDDDSVSTYMFDDNQVARRPRPPPPTRQRRPSTESIYVL